MPAVPPVRDGHRRRFSDAQRARVLAEAARPGASVSEVARRYCHARRETGLSEHSCVRRIVERSEADLRRDFPTLYRDRVLSVYECLPAGESRWRI